jgi:putative ABC transport system ATP-binding protein
MPAGRLYPIAPNRCQSAAADGAAVAIHVEDVWRTYGTGAAACTALRGVTFEIPSGTFVAVAGPSGSGKTTLLSIVGGLDHSDSGRVLIEGQDLAKASEAELSEIRLRRMGFVFQDFNLIPVLSAAENVEFPLLFRHEVTHRERRTRAREMLERVGLGAKLDKRPHQLSGGECQRVAVARALAGDPAIVLADEPTANLDQDTGVGVIKLMIGLNRERGATFLYATHEARLLALADSVLYLRDGAIEDRP